MCYATLLINLTSTTAAQEAGCCPYPTQELVWKVCLQRKAMDRLERAAAAKVTNIVFNASNLTSRVSLRDCCLAHPDLH